MGYLVPQPFAIGGNQLYPDILVGTGDPQYPGYKTLTVAPEPSIERVTRVVHSTRGRIGTHMIL
jgi:hypothetical protein